MWPMATIGRDRLPVSARSCLASAFTASTGSATWKGPSDPGFVSSGMSGFENPTNPTRRPGSIVNTFDFAHSGGVLPASSTMFAER